LLGARARAAFDMLGVGHGGRPIVAACSGGADSAAVLDLLRTSRPQHRIVACYVDHAMRPTASIARDIRAVKQCARLARVEFAQIGLTPAIKRDSPEASMRERRYRALAEYAASIGASDVVTGHHRDDLAETMLLGLIRGSGIDGLSAMQPRRPIGGGVDLVRPLLWASKDELAGHAREAGLPVSEDETNADRRYRRNAVRALLQKVEQEHPGAVASIARSAALISEERALLEALTATAWHRSQSRTGGGLSARELRTLPDGLLARVIRREIRERCGSLKDFSYDHCTAIVEAIRDARGGRFHAGNAQVDLSAGRLVVRPHRGQRETARRDAEFSMPAQSARVFWNGGTLQLRRLRARPAAVRADRSTLYLDGGRLPAGVACTVRAPRPGDRLIPAGRRSLVSLANFLAKQRLTKEERRAVPLLCRGDEIVAVLAVRAAADYAARAAGNVLEVVWQPAKTVYPQAHADE
jgi:tRNA(Ile)-lysidine synthase